MHNCLYYYFLWLILFCIAIHRVPTEEQVSHYDHALLGAIRENNVRQLSDLMTSGKCMTACNKFSESILHMACRRSTPEVVAFLTAHGASLEAVDDYGRTPLHDACWRAETDFALVTFILDHNSELLRCVDDRGATPLDYVREQQWPEWRDFLRRKADTYWAPKRVRDDSPVTTTASAAFSYEGTQRGGGNDHMPVATPCGESNGNGDNHDGTRARASSNEQEI